MIRVRNVFWAAILPLSYLPFSSSAQTNVTFTTMVAFAGTNGHYPYASLVQGSDGNFYGTTREGGANSYGTVFKMTPDGTLTTLFAFSNSNGSSPEAPLIQGNDGKFYGTTQRGGTNGDNGTVFSITTDGIFNSLASFAGTNGANIPAGLVQGTDGNFYGTTVNGGIKPPPLPGQSAYGTVFMMTLVEGKDGHYYGTTQGASYNYNYGTIFRMDTNGVVNTLFNFKIANIGTAGSVPQGPLLLASDGNFYGMTMSGGAYGFGTVFRIDTNGTLTALVSFNKTNGANTYTLAPLSGHLVQATDGNFYGVTSSGGASNSGTIFMMTPSGTLTTLYSFIGGTNGANPTGLIQASDGNFYGTTTFTSMTGDGGTLGDGTIFRISIPLQPVFTSVTQSNNMINLTWSTVTSHTYQLQFATDLTSTNWSNLKDIITATNGTMSATDVLGSDPQRFYRVLLLQSP